jgi:ferritin-like protein
LAVEPPLRVEHREELVWLLAQACELEHGLMCEYLFAQFTLKRSADEGLSLEQLAKVATWEAVLVEVTKQEMLHLALATKLLTAIGAAPHLHRPNFPILSRWYPTGVRVALLRFGERALPLHLPGAPRGDGPGRRRRLRRRRPGPATDRR